MMDDATADFVAERDRFVVPTLAIIRTLIEQGGALGIAPNTREKVESISRQAVRGLDSMRNSE